MGEKGGSSAEGGWPQVVRPNISFRDKVLGGTPLPLRDLLEDLIQHKLASVVIILQYSFYTSENNFT